MAAALTADNPDFGGATQKSDGLLGGTPNTDSRVFGNADNTLVVEIDLVADTSTSSATSDYTAYKTAASGQVTTQTSTSSPSIAQQANEYAGTNSAGKNAVSISFVEGKFIAVVTMISTGTVSGATLTGAAEVLAQDQDTKIKAQP
jgi:hypothetical protein